LSTILSISLIVLALVSLIRFMRDGKQMKVERIIKSVNMTSNVVINFLLVTNITFFKFFHLKWKVIWKIAKIITKNVYEKNKFVPIYLSKNSLDSRLFVSKTTFNISGPIFAWNVSTQNEFTIARKYKQNAIIER